MLDSYKSANTDRADCAGPKIDINVFDALGRKHQCATIQLDFQLPIRFGLKYNAPPSAEGGEETEQRPVLIHRAIFGSLERFTAILIEHIAGKWPLWLSPRQVAIVPVGSDQHEYGAEVQAVLRKEGYHADLDSSSKTLQKKIRDNQLAHLSALQLLSNCPALARLALKPNPVCKLGAIPKPAGARPPGASSVPARSARPRAAATCPACGCGRT